MAADAKAPNANLKEDVGDKADRFSPEEEASMVTESNTHKTEANSLFALKKYDAALNKYDEAIAVCPDYLDYEIAVLRSNIALCHLKLKEWKEAINNATTALDRLNELEIKEKEKQRQAEEDDMVEDEIVSSGAAAAGPALPDHSKEEAEAARKKLEKDIGKIRVKTLFRRALARGALGGWSNLEGAIEDYRKLGIMDVDLRVLGEGDKKLVRRQLSILPPRARAAQEKETAEMWDKLKDLGNGLLKPFGLSTDNFKMVKDENTGGYSMNFEGGNKGTG